MAGYKCSIFTSKENCNTRLRLDYNAEMTNMLFGIVILTVDSESRMDVSDRFNIDKYTVFAHVHKFCLLVKTHLSHFLTNGTNLSHGRGL